MSLYEEIVFQNLGQEFPELSSAKLSLSIDSGEKVLALTMHSPEDLWNLWKNYSEVSRFLRETGVAKYLTLAVGNQEYAPLSFVKESSFVTDLRSLQLAMLNTHSACALIHKTSNRLVFATPEMEGTSGRDYVYLTSEGANQSIWWDPASELERDRRFRQEQCLKDFIYTGTYWKQDEEGLFYRVPTQYKARTMEIIKIGSTEYRLTQGIEIVEIGDREPAIASH